MQPRNVTGDTRVESVSSRWMAKSTAILPIGPHHSSISHAKEDVPIVPLSTPLGEPSRAQAIFGQMLFFLALAVVSVPLFDSGVDAESIVNNRLLIKKNASYANAYLLGAGFYDEFVAKMRSNRSSVTWFPQRGDDNFLSFPFLDQAAFSNGACSILGVNDRSSPECILMTGHDGGVSSYGLCRNGSEFVSVHYVMSLVTPADIGGLVASGSWIDNARESVTLGLIKPPVCAAGNTVVIHPNVSDLRDLSGPFMRVSRGPTNQWLDTMGLPAHVRARMFYLSAKDDPRQGVTLPFVKRQSFDRIIAQNTFGSTLADRLEIVAPFSTSRHVHVMLYRVAGADITLPRLKFTFAVAGQTMLLLAFISVIAIRNSAITTYHLVQQLMRLPTFLVIAAQLLYVLYYQIFEIAYVNNIVDQVQLSIKKIAYVAAVSFVLLHQLDVRAVGAIAKKRVNGDSYYAVRIVCILAPLAVFLWSLCVQDADGYTVATSSSCALRASECNTTRLLLWQHHIFLGLFCVHPAVCWAIQALQWRRNRHEYICSGRRNAEQLTSFETIGCSGCLNDYYYYYNTLVTPQKDKLGNGDDRRMPGANDSPTLKYLTCAKVVRDEGFVMLDGCRLLVRAKDLPWLVLMKLLPVQLARTTTVSIVGARVVDNRLRPMQRVSNRALWRVCKQWDGRISYPDIG